MLERKTAQSLAAIAIFIALIILVILCISEKLIKPKLEDIYKNAAEMIEY